MWDVVESGCAGGAWVLAWVHQSLALTEAATRGGRLIRHNDGGGEWARCSSSRNLASQAINEECESENFVSKESLSRPSFFFSVRPCSSSSAKGLCCVVTTLAVDRACLVSGSDTPLLRLTDGGRCTE